MSRPLRIEYQDAYYHVMNRGWRRGKIFKKEIEFKAFIKTLKEACLQYGVYLNAYCIMNNHYHLLVHTPRGNLSQFMRQVNGVYARKYNIINKTEGAVFRGRYKSILVQDGVYLLRIMRYIHFNPIKAGLVKELDGYRWSSHSSYKRGKDEAWLKVIPVLGLLDTEDKDLRVSYKQYMKLQKDDEIEQFYSRKNIESVLGEKGFADHVYQRNYERLNGLSGVSQTRFLYGMQIMRKVMGEVIGYFEIDEERLVRKSQGYENLPLQLCVFLSRSTTNLTFNEIARELQFRSDRSVESCYNRFQIKLTKRKEVRGLLELLKERCRYAGT